MLNSARAILKRPALRARMLRALDRVADFLSVRRQNGKQKSKEEPDARCRDERLERGEIDIRIDYGLYRSSELSRLGFAIFGETAPLATVVPTASGAGFISGTARFSTTDSFASINKKSSAGIRVTWAVTLVTVRAITFNCNTDNPTGKDTSVTFNYTKTTPSSAPAR